MAPNQAAQPAPAAAPAVAAPQPQQAAMPAKLHLPVLVFGVVEVRRLKRELEALEDYVAQAQLRTPGKQAALPRLSRLLDALATENNMNLLQAEHRTTLKKFLEDTEAHAPSLHISFAADPSSAFTAKMVKWLRANIAPDALMEVGLQPTIAAGCIVRTTNKVFDLSLRSRFGDAEGLLLQALDKAGPAPEVHPVDGAPAAETAAPAVAAPVSAVTPPAQEQDAQLSAQQPAASGATMPQQPQSAVPATPGAQVAVPAQAASAPAAATVSTPVAAAPAQPAGVAP